MPFIGKSPTAGFSTIVKDDLTADGSTTAFTLSKQVASANDIAVFVGNVRQEPTDAYSVSGTTLTMTAAPASGINFYVLHIAGTLESSVIPADNTISTAKLQNDSVTGAKIEDNPTISGNLTTSVASGQNKILATNSGTTSSDTAIFQGSAGSYYNQMFMYGSGESYFQTNGNSLTFGTTSNSPVYIKTNNTNRMIIDEDGVISVPNQPVAYRTGATSGNNWITLTASTHTIFDNWYQTSNLIGTGIADNGRFTATVAGTYLVSGEWYTTDSTSSGTYGYGYFYKNGSAYGGGSKIMNYGGHTNDQAYQSVVPIELAVNDYVQIGAYAASANWQVYGPNTRMWVYFLG